MLAPTVGGLLFSTSLVLALTVFAAAFLIGGAVVAAFGGETRGVPLGDTLGELERTTGKD